MKSNIFEICEEKLKEKGLNEDPRYRKRLSWEQQEIVSQDKENYFKDLLIRGVKHPDNENNLLICWLLDIVPNFNIEEDPKCTYGDFPDVDSDYLPAVRDFLKNEWAPKTFGEQYVSNIGNYTTFGIKSSLIDMVRVHGESREHILALTTKLQTKDEEGKILTWDSAMRTDPLLKKYCDEHPDIAKAAQKLIDRNRGMGVHAGGLIVSSIPLTDLVPLVKRKDSPQASAWVEGLHGQDLQPVGLVKFDLLVISNLLQIAYCCKLIKDRHNIDKICALPGQGNWSDIEEYRNNPDSLAMANDGDLKCIFQFDSPGIRSLAKAGGVTRFEDLVAYSSLYRPGPLNMKMHERYVERKRGREEYKLHPILDEILKDTYGVIIYQEQVMKILNIVGNIPMRDVETVRKAISKKKVEQFIKYKEVFIKNGKKNLSCTEEESTELFNQLISFSEYGFNKSVDKHTFIPTPNGLKKILDFQKGDKVYCIDEQGNKVETDVVNLHDHGTLEGYKVVFDDGYEIICTIDHKFLTKDGQISLREILIKDVSVFCEKEYGQQYTSKKPIKSSISEINVKNCFGLVESNSDHAPISNISGLLPRKVVHVVPVGKCHMFDLEVANRTHNFILPNGIVTSNSHACAYTHISARLLYLKSHFPHEFYTAILMCESDTDKIKDYRREAIKHGVNLKKINVNVSKENFSLVGDEIYFGLSNVKGIGEPIAKEIVKGQPYKNFEDFIERFGTDASVLKPLLSLRCFEEDDSYKLFLFAEKYKDYAKKNQDRKKRFQNTNKKNKEILLNLVENAENTEFIKMKISNKTLEAIDIKDLKKVSKKTCDEWKKRYSGLLVDGKDAWKEICKMIRKIQVAKERFYSKEDSIKPKLADIILDQSKKDKLKEEFDDPVVCEKKYYGFTWQSNIEKSPDYKGGLTFDCLEPDTNDVFPVEIEVISIQKKKGKKTEYYQLKAEDSNGDEGVINVWKDDYAVFSEEFEPGNFLRIRLSAPSNGFKTYTISSLGPRNFYKKPTPLNKSEDYRVVLLRKPEK